MQPSPYHYLPLTPAYFAILTGIFAVVLILLLSLRYAYLSLGVSSFVATGLLLGSLIGADLTNLEKVRGLGAPIASIGGAGTFDGIFLTGILAVLLASLYSSPRRAAG